MTGRIIELLLALVGLLFEVREETTYFGTAVQATNLDHPGGQGLIEVEVGDRLRHRCRFDPLTL
jgi:hypothetical protein